MLHIYIFCSVYSQFLFWPSCGISAQLPFKVLDRFSATDCTNCMNSHFKGTTPKTSWSLLSQRTHHFVSAWHRTPSWSPHIARISQWQRVANASGLLASARFSARLRTSARTPGMAGWKLSSTARDKKRQERKRDKTVGLWDEGMDGDEVDKIIFAGQTQRWKRLSVKVREERRDRREKSSSPLSCFTQM